jgi:hypothetical protein
MSFVTRSLPPEADDPPLAPPTALQDLAAERDRLRSLVRRGIRTRHQVRILRQIAEITRQILSERSKP